jgi:hypothetical protein
MPRSIASRQEQARPARPPLIIEYTNLLHQYRDPGAPAVKDFLRRHRADVVFRKRAEVLNRVFRLKAELTPLGS